MVRIEQWAVIFVSGDLYTPPEQRQCALLGNVYGHPDFADGFLVKTSVLTGASVPREVGHVVQSDSRQYLLGQPSESYLQWLKKLGIAYDSAQPIR